MIQTVYIVIAATGIMLAGAGANEASHGDFSENMGLGHHHMADYDGHHCADPGDVDWEQHVEHMHDGAGRHCGSGHMNHQGHSGGSMT